MHPSYKCILHHTRDSYIQATCVAEELDAFRQPMTSFPSGSIRLNVTVEKNS